MSEIIVNGITIEDFLQRVDKLIEIRLGQSHTKQAQKNLNEYLTRKEVATILRISLPTLHFWVKHGYITAYKVGNRVYFKPEEISQAVTTLSGKRLRKSS